MKLDKTPLRIIRLVAKDGLWLLAKWNNGTDWFAYASSN